ncbi:hypothetical protein TorRG33x02_327210, partial [Trema orientale]
MSVLAQLGNLRLCWKVRLSSGALKLNIDATLGSGKGAIDIRAVIRDASRAICGALAKNFPGNFRVFLDESLTLRDSLRFALNYNLIPKFVESNSRNTIFALNNEVSGSLE